MQVSPFFLDYWFFHIVNYLLAAVAYTLIGRMLLSILVKPDSNFFVMRFFRAVTDPAIYVMRPLTPGFLHPFFVPLYVAFWIFVLRFVFGMAMLNFGLAPSLATAA